MPTRVDLPVTQIVRDGVAFPNDVLSDPVNDHSFTNDGRVFLDFFNTGATTIVTIETPGTVGGLAIADEAVTVPGGGTVSSGPFAPSLFNQPGTSTVYVDVLTANVKIRAWRL